MQWIVKSALQNCIAVLPERVSLAAYYQMQRFCGGLRNYDPTSRLVAGAETWRRILATGRDPKRKIFLEVGTGRAPVLPIALHLLGCARTVTVDLNPYMKKDLVLATVRFIQKQENTVRTILGAHLDQERLQGVLGMDASGAMPLHRTLDHLGIDYIAPGDASKLPLADASIDYHVSYTVFEHIPPQVLAAILREGLRVTCPAGLFIHKIDYSDHFAHSDRRITLINFLRYGERTWNILAGNRYMYMNRLRHRDYLRIFVSNGLRIVTAETTLDQRSLNAIGSGELKPHLHFIDFSPEELATIGAWICACAENRN